MSIMRNLIECSLWELCFKIITVAIFLNYRNASYLCNLETPSSGEILSYIFYSNKFTFIYSAFNAISQHYEQKFLL